MTVIVIEHAVSVEKSGRPLTLTRNLSLRAGERLGKPDIDEIPLVRDSQKLVAMSQKREYVFFERIPWAKNVDQSAPAGIDAAADESASRMMRTVAEPRYPVPFQL